MRVFISADIEGCTGLVSWSQCSRPNGQFYDYEFARRMMTHDVNAAIEGAFEGGATSVVVKDSHGNSKNLILEQLDPRAELVSGQGASTTDGMMIGVDASFDVAFLVGYHAMAGTLNGVMEHTITGGIHRLWINGQETGEMGLSAGVAGQYGVPLALVVSDRAGCVEATRSFSGVKTFETKVGLGRYMAQLKPVAETHRGIVEVARMAVQDPLPAPHVFDGPTDLRIEFNRAEEADMVARLSTLERHDGYTVKGTFPSYAAAHETIWGAVELSFQGIRAQD
jgi:D-amino peptidase